MTDDNEDVRCKNVPGIYLESSKAKFLENPGNGLCGIWSVLQAISYCDSSEFSLGLQRNKSSRIPEKNMLEIIAEAMSFLHKMSARLLSVSQKSRDIAASWTIDVLEMMIKRNKLENEIFWNSELLQSYVSKKFPDYDMFYFIQNPNGKLVLVNISGSKTFIFSEQRRFLKRFAVAKLLRDSGHCHAILEYIVDNKDVLDKVCNFLSSIILF
jgi:hypothetical protein